MQIDLKRRSAVMARSQKLGHCICNPQHPCPCPPLIEQNICPCAGERAPTKSREAALTRHVRRAGCASKIGQADLLQVLSALPRVTDPRVLIGAAAGDDAGVYQLDERTALVQTVDVFTPCVDDPHLFGQIAAANSVSDVYAMGGRPITALSIVGFPIEVLDTSLLEQMLRGGIEKLEEARCALIGGHSINDEEMKFGFAVTGVIDANKVIARDRAQAGDLLVLTKPLGTGMAAFAAQLGLLPPRALEAIGASMATLNKDGAELMVALEAHACTDVTGFGLAGHLVAMAQGSGVVAEIDLASTPVFAVVPECLRRDIFGGAVERNQAYAMAWIDATAARPEHLPVLYDPQTSGGLLVALPPDRAEDYVREMRARGHEATSIIGRIIEQRSSEREPCVRVEGTELRCLVGEPTPLLAAPGSTAQPEPPAPIAIHALESCCDSVPDWPPRESVASMASQGQVTNTEKEDPVDTLDSFKAFMKEANAPGLIDAQHKKLMAIVLSVAHRCRPCLKIHLESAVKMGIEKARIDEAAALAIAFGGCTDMMFFKEVCQEVGI